MKQMASWAMRYIPLVLISSYCYSVIACTGIRLMTQDNSVVYARTLEWREDIRSKALVVPRGMQYVGTSANNKQGMSWINKYAFTGINLFDYPFLIDGLNEKGLGAGLFAFHDNVQYHVADPNDSSCDLAPWEFVTYLLSNFSNVQEVLLALPHIKVVPVVLKETWTVEPFHYVVHDMTGECIVLEHVNHEFKVFLNPLGVVTNSPTFDWHLTNLKNYTNLPVPDSTPLRSDADRVIDLKCETSVLGLPGNFSSTSRFVRAVLYSRHALSMDNRRQGVLQAFHLLNQFDIPRGLVRTIHNANVTYTHWTSVADLASKQYYFRTYHNQRIRMIDLNICDLDGTKITYFPMDGQEDIQDLTAQKSSTVTTPNFAIV